MGERIDYVQQFDSLSPSDLVSTDESDLKEQLLKRMQSEKGTE